MTARVVESLLRQDRVLQAVCALECLCTENVCVCVCEFVFMCAVCEGVPVNAHIVNAFVCTCIPHT